MTGRAAVPTAAPRRMPGEVRAGNRRQHHQEGRREGMADGPPTRQVREGQVTVPIVPPSREKAGAKATVPLFGTPVVTRAAGEIAPLYLPSICGGGGVGRSNYTVSWPRALGRYSET